MTGKSTTKKTSVRRTTKSAPQGVATAKTPTHAKTAVWGKSLESGRWIKLPRIFLRAGRYSELLGTKIKPRHLLLLLALGSQKYQRNQIRAYWENLAIDLGVSTETVRKWGYELRKMGLLKIKQNRGRGDIQRVGHRNESNTFDLSPFIKFMEELDQKWPKKKREDAK